jgi:sulfate adenylyltransferase subunit 1
MDWYPGATLMGLLDTVKIDDDKNLDDFRLPIQYVTRPNLDFRGFCGTVAGGVINVGDVVTALPSGKSSSVKAIVTADGELEMAHVGQAITLTLNDEIDISRGDVIVRSNKLATVSEKFEAVIVWMSEAALKPGKEYELKIGSKNTYARIENINYRIDVNTLEHIHEDEMQLNEISSCNVVTTHPVVIDEYDKVQGTGSFVIIERLTNITVGAGMITKAVVDDKGIEPELIKQYTQMEVELNAFIRSNYPEWNCKTI